MRHTIDNIGATYLRMVVMMYTVMMLSLNMFLDSIKKSSERLNNSVLNTIIKEISIYMFVTAFITIEIGTKYLLFTDQSVKIWNIYYGSGSDIESNCMIALEQYKNTILYTVCASIGIVSILTIVLGQIIDRFSQRVLLETTHCMKFVNSCITPVKQLLRISSNSILESGRVFEFTEKYRIKKELHILLQLVMSYLMVITILVIVTFSSIIESGQLFRTVYEDLIVLIENENCKLQVLNTYLKVVNIIGIVTLRSIISPGKLIEAVKNYIVSLWVLNFSKIITIQIDHDLYVGCIMGQLKRFYYIDISIIGSGQLIETTKQYITDQLQICEIFERKKYEIKDFIIYLRVIVIGLVVALCSIIRSGRLIEIIQQSLISIHKLQVFSTYLGVVIIMFIVTLRLINGAGQFIGTIQIYSASLLMYSHSNMIIILRNLKYYITQILNYIKRLYLLGQVTNVLFTLFLSRSYVAKIPLYICGLFCSYTRSLHHLQIEPGQEVLHRQDHRHQPHRRVHPQEVVADRQRSENGDSHMYCNTVEEYLSELPPTPDIPMLLDDRSICVFVSYIFYPLFMWVWYCCF